MSASQTPTLPPSKPSSPAPVYRRTPLKIGCVQYDVKLGRVKENAAKVEELTKWMKPGHVDLLVLPEMCLSGYVFNSPISILPYLEAPRIGPTSLLARALATRLGCHVIAGYPELIPSSSSPSSSPTITTDTAPKEMEGEALGVGYNSAVIVSPLGEVVGNYRKTFRFETDKTWAREGDGFQYFDLSEPLGRVALGICMDLNPKDFIAPWDAFELANFCRDNAVDMLVMPMNWLSPPAEPPITTPASGEEPPRPVEPPEDPEAPSEANLNYWAARLVPLHDPTPRYSTAPSTSTSTPIPGSEPKSGREGEGKEVVFVACNRIGEEEGTKFIGTSCVMTISSTPSRIELVECCNISEERVLIATV
ncbi:protein N-terminal amidase [Cryptococcus gattii E566]|uniref:Protein N-terminal asparagine amidohydrolase, putative n=2 Tax=Cryptococcus gattii TaxID=37769 RepID=E6RD33_CRYGW|nr:Protein N-terminal asparagine amidohydrolase, putative [Cryptococcus gattii WM276]ADV24796.1 Protein N-terminal asparagine amidohydrolase, putative [Cryptococcus gattii WM276]KIR79352.1 protein N-terminal amidase [Cryptococcus gattii EJB2]KIY35139.1 protein N-terminal amidase [Cryptococcus gattii E566]KJE00090.1 protein N-terminal amidase [Cryptococcus gattii NT-10]